jgi:hypothetical protein
MAAGVTQSLQPEARDLMTSGAARRHRQLKLGSGGMAGIVPYNGGEEGFRFSRGAISSC